MSAKKRDKKQEALNRKRKALLLYKITGRKITRTKTSGQTRSSGVSAKELKEYLASSKLGNLSVNTLEKLAQSLPLLRSGTSITQTAEIVNIPRKTLKKAGLSFGIFENDSTGKAKTVKRFVTVYVKNLGAVDNIEVSYQNASIAGRWWQEIAKLKSKVKVGK